MAKDNDLKKKKKKKISKGEIVKKVAIWIMLIAMVASLFTYAFSALFA